MTRPENLGSSNKRANLLSLYQNLLPNINPAKASLLASFSAALFPSPLAPPQIQAIYDELTQTVSVHGEDDMVALWRRGFFGKGSLSRSEPSWKRRVENRRAEFEGGQQRPSFSSARIGRGRRANHALRTGLTAEEVTALRRIERKTTKHVKKAKREAEKLLAASAAASEWGSSIGSPAGSRSASLPTDAEVTADEEEELVRILGKIEEERVEGPSEGATEAPGPEADNEPKAPPPLWQLTAEYTQLQHEEAFFLLFSLGVLSILSSSPLTPDVISAPLSISSAWERFLLDTAVLAAPPTAGLPHPALSRLDSPFLINYAAYHHYRSMGWVARSGIKFCVDWVLYGQGGPVGGHAESVASLSSDHSTRILTPRPPPFLLPGSQSSSYPTTPTPPTRKPAPSAQRSQAPGGQKARTRTAGSTSTPSTASAPA